MITDYRSLTQPTVQSFHLVKSFVRQGPSEEEEARLASESRKELFEEIPDESELPLLISKKYAKYSSTWNDTCPECRKKLTQSLFSWGAKFCNYTGKYYCTECFGNAKSVIPAKLFNNWDSTEYSVSSQSKCLIDMHMRDPIFHYYHINPEIRRTNLTLEAVIGLRKRIKLFYPYISSCANGSKLIYEFGERKYYLTSAYQLSLQDLVDCISRKSYVQLEGFVKQLLDHVAGCQSCKGKGFYCEICGGKKGGILFSFSLPEEAVCCPKCHSFVHTKCAKTIPGGFTPMTCPKCCRIEDFKRKKAIKEGKSEKDNTQ